jgi:1,4-dihydroxy-2-naphthoate octaprenyltransferase
MIVGGYLASVVLAFGLIVIGVLTGSLPAWTLLALATIPLAMQVYSALGSHYESPYELMSAMGKNIMLHLFSGLALIAGYVLEIIV